MTVASTYTIETALERPRAFALVAVFACTLFLSAALMFLVEPMIARMVAPILGGAPMVWNTCVMFFQLALLAGYGYAWALSRWVSVRAQALIHVAVLGAGLLLLPIAFAPGLAPPPGNPVGWLVARLAITAGLPFFAVSTSASILQHWFSRTDHRLARDPYFLYTASNLGSFLALLAYPVLVETTLRLRMQARVWGGGYAIFVALVAICAVGMWRAHGRDDSARPRTAAAARPLDDVEPSSGRRVRWVGLAFVPSSLMLSVTSYLGMEVAAVPLLWVVPLALYLLTFVLAFGAETARYRRIADRAMPLLILPVALFMLSQAAGSLALLLMLHLSGFAAAALTCHTLLASDRPAASRLTEFYFWIALGGMLGGVFNTLVAPLVFTHVIEYPLGLVLACLLRASFIDLRRPLVSDAIFAVALGALTLAIGFGVPRAGGEEKALLAVLSIPALVLFSQSRRPLRFGLGIAVMLLVGAMFGETFGRVLYRDRTFFGTYRVTEDAGRHMLFHGSTLHGIQAVDEKERAEPLTYFHRGGPIGQAFAQVPALTRTPSVAVVGLGIGSLAAYAGANQHWTFYEIDPAVEGIARNPAFFTHLRDCGERCRVVIGDARLSLAKAAPASYGLLVLDAFSSDAIPIHLMTSEAMALYLSRLTAHGILAFHISNRHLLLGPVVAREAAAHGLVALERVQSVTEAENKSGKTSSDWILMAHAPEDLGSLHGAAGWVPPRMSDSTPLWTDDFSNLFSVLRLR